MKIPFPSIETELQTDLDSIKGTAMKGAFLKGAIAYREKGPEAINPYIQAYKDNGGATWTKAFRNMWDRGYMSYKKYLKRR